jgi:hypothetical protein
MHSSFSNSLFYSLLRFSLLFFLLAQSLPCAVVARLCEVGADVNAVNGEADGCYSAILLAGYLG